MSVIQLQVRLLHAGGVYVYVCVCVRSQRQLFRISKAQTEGQRVEVEEVGSGRGNMSRLKRSAAATSPTI